MRASLIVVSYNSRAYLGACLSAALAELGPDDELIVVDNASGDGSAELVAEEFPRARLLRAPNGGYAGGNNRGAAVARGEVLIFLNPDTRLLPGAVEALLAPFADGGVGLSAACVVLMGRPEVVNAAGNTVHFTGLTYCRGAGRPRAELAEACDLDAVSGAAFAIRRALFSALGGFDEGFFMYVEDTDLSLRARLAGARVRYAPGALVEHDYAMSMSPAKAFYLDRNRLLMLLKNLEGATLLRMLPGLLLGELATAGFHLLRGPRFWGVKARVYADLLRRRGRIAAARRGAAATRRLKDREALAGLTHRLDLGQVAAPPLAALAGLLLHPAFRLARRLALGPPRATPPRGPAG